MLLMLLSILVLVSAILTIRAEYRGPRRRVYLFKPLTVVLIILIAWQAKFPASPFYRYLVVAGLLCSLAGDVFLMLPRDRFVEGLLSFLVAHLFYIAAFTYDGGRVLNVWAAVPLLAYGGLMLGLLWMRLGRMRVPVVIYVLAILLMAWQASNRWLATGEAGSLLALFGALLFVASDSMLAWDRFRGRFRNAHALVLGTYFAAQLLIALST
jgi:uncharacterized membrane protein YhhN